MLNNLIKFILISLIIFTPLALGSVEIWAFSLMELGILLIIALYVIQEFLIRNPQSAIRNPHLYYVFFSSPSSFSR